MAHILSRNLAFKKNALKLLSERRRATPACFLDKTLFEISDANLSISEPLIIVLFRKKITSDYKTTRCIFHLAVLIVPETKNDKTLKTSRVFF